MEDDITRATYARGSGKARCYDCDKSGESEPGYLPEGWMEHALDGTVHCETCADSFDCACGAQAFERGQCPTCARHAARIDRNARIAAGHVDPIYVLAVSSARMYGGPEEGGWFWDYVVVSEVRKAWDWRGALRHARELRAEYPTCPRGRHSVIGGTDVSIVCRRDPREFPTEVTSAPRWE